MKIKTIYRILKTPLSGMGNQEFDTYAISAKKMGITYAEWSSVLILLQKSGYVDGVVYTETASGKRQEIVSVENISITIPGIEYVETSGAMAKAKAMLEMAGVIL